MFFTAKDLQELRNQYKDLCFKHHPDVSGYDSTLIMQQINDEYNTLSKKFSSESNFEDSELQFAELFKEKIEILIKIKSIQIEIIGNWIWVTGDTKPIKDLLKAMKFQFAPKKIAWYFKTYTYRKKGKELVNLDDIRAVYGSKKYEYSQTEDLQLN